MHKVVQNKTKIPKKKNKKKNIQEWVRGKLKISKFETEPQWEMSVSRTSVNPLQSGTEIKIFDLKQDNCIIYRSLSILVYNKYTIINAVTYKKRKN